MVARIAVVAAALLLAALGGGGARAATTTYPVSVFGVSALPGAANLIGNNPSVANINRNSSAGLNYGTDITKFTLSFTVTSVTPNTTYLWVRFGRLTSGLLFTNANGVGLRTPGGAASQNIYVPITGPGVYFVNSMAFAAGCATIGGCNAVVFGNSTFSAPGSRFGVSVVGATPEPSVWALMILGFVGVAGRLKQARARPGRALASV